MNKDEYIIINRTSLEKEKEELKDQLKTLGDIHKEEIHAHGFISGEINRLEKTLSQSIPLIPEIEKAFEAGRKLTVDGFEEEDFQDYEDYISKLKLDI